MYIEDYNKQSRELRGLKSNIVSKVWIENTICVCLSGAGYLIFFFICVLSFVGSCAYKKRSEPSSDPELRRFEIYASQVVTQYMLEALASTFY